jgi:hypothetical protein
LTHYRTHKIIMLKMSSCINDFMFVLHTTRLQEIYLTRSIITNPYHIIRSFIIVCACHMIFVNVFFFCICICLCFALTISRLKTTLSKSDNKMYITPYLHKIIMLKLSSCTNDFMFLLHTTRLQEIYLRSSIITNPYHIIKSFIS